MCNAPPRRTQAPANFLNLYLPACLSRSNQPGSNQPDRQPFFIRGPGIRPGHVITDKIGLNIDVAPTIAGLIGTKPPAEALIDGRSLEPLLFADVEASCVVARHCVGVVQDLQQLAMHCDGTALHGHWSPKTL